jgi:NTE family protein
MERAVGVEAMDEIAPFEGFTRQVSSVPLFGSLDGPALSALEAELETLSLPGGRTLFHEGDDADSLYLVLAGCLAITVCRNGRDVPVARSHAGELVGEMALLGGGLRSATVTALRDTELLRLGKPSFEKLIARHPASMLPLVSLLARRLRDTTHYLEEPAAIRTIALVPICRDVDHRAIAHDLSRMLTASGQRVALLDCAWVARGAEWFTAVEATTDLVLYCADHADSAWTRLCLRQADRVALVASSNAQSSVCAWTPREDELRQAPDLVVFHGRHDRGCAVGDQNRLGGLPINCVYHLRAGSADDLGRLGRLLTGKGVGLVLSAGGARGFAHLGVIRALREARISIDLIGGCSMGAIVGAGVALEWEDAEIIERLRRAFVRSNPINDYTLPFLALAKGQKVARRLEEHFGSTGIEQTWCPFFCVSTNLTTGSLVVHRSGPLACALRASISIPGLLPPVMIDGEAHVDGGMINSLPVDVMRSMSGATIAVDVTTGPAPAPTGRGDMSPSVWQFLRHGGTSLPIVDTLVRAATVSSETAARVARADADILFAPALESVGILDWAACDRAIDAGYRYAVKKLENCDLSKLPGLLR